MEIPSDSELEVVVVKKEEDPKKEPELPANWEPKEDRTPLELLAQPHIDSFDYFVKEGLGHVVDQVEGVEVGIPYCDISRPTSDILDSFGPLNTKLYRNLSILQVIHPETGEIFRFWLDGVAVGVPVKEEGRGPEKKDHRIFPRECREGVRI